MLWGKLQTRNVLGKEAVAVLEMDVGKSGSCGQGELVPNNAVSDGSRR